MVWQKLGAWRLEPEYIEKKLEINKGTDNLEKELEKKKRLMGDMWYFKVIIEKQMTMFH